MRRASTYALLHAILLGMMLLVSGCAIVPGYDAYTLRMSKHSSVKLPVMQQDGTSVAEIIPVQEITAETIIMLEQAVQQKRAAMQVLESTHAGDYRLGPGDVITIVLWGHPDLGSGEFQAADTAGTLVSKDGTIFFPHAGEVKVAGLTVAEVRRLLTERVGRVIENVQLEVRMTSFRSKRVYVVGEVTNPGVFSITDIPMTVVDAINEAGGFTPLADRSDVRLNRNGGISVLDLFALFEDGDLSQNILLEPGDIISVPDNTLNKVFIMGEVLRTQTLQIGRGRVTLTDVLSDARNINMNTASPAHIFVVRGGPVPQIFHLDAKEPDALLLGDRFPIQSRDIVYVDTADLVRWNKFISNLLPSRNFFNLDTSLQDGGTGY